MYCTAPVGFSKGEPSRGQTGLHSRSSDLTSELQSSVRSDEVVIATEQLQVLIEPRCAFYLFIRAPQT